MSCPFRSLWTGGKQGDISQPDNGAIESPDTTAGKVCPFSRLGVGSSAAKNDAKCASDLSTAVPPSKATACPFGYGAASADAQPKEDAAGPSANGMAPQGAAPVAPSDGQQQQPNNAGGAKCPYGFGASSNGPKMSELHCVLCRGLLHDCCTTRCGHTFCAACIARFSDCPICGADVEDATPNLELQGRVDQLVEAHAGSSTLWELEARAAAAPGVGDAGVAQQAVAAAAPVGKEAGGGNRDRATFFLQLGLRSLAGGNPHAAIDRLGRARAELLSSLREAEQGQQASGDGNGVDSISSISGGEERGQEAVSPAAATATAAAQEQAPASPAAAVMVADLCCKLGSVAGSLGDCHRQLGDVESAGGCYQESIGLLQRAGAAAADAGPEEACHALTVSLNKLGDLRYASAAAAAAAALAEAAAAGGDGSTGAGHAAPSPPAEVFSEVAGLYREALQLRRGLWRGARQEEEAHLARGAGGSAGGGGAGPAAVCYALDVAVSLAKLADVCQVMGNGLEASSLVAEARDITRDISDEVEASGGPLQAKYRGLLAALDATSG